MSTPEYHHIDEAIPENAAQNAVPDAAEDNAQEIVQNNAEELPEAAAQTAEPKPAHDPARTVFEWVESLVPALMIVVLFFLFVARLIGVDGTSMLPTLEDGDYLIISKLFYDPQPGDIVVLTKEGFLVNQYDREDSFVKRIIAVEGQRVRIDYDEGAVYVDGVKQDDSFTYTPTTRRGDYEFPEEGIVVPEGCIFVLGDNRNGSTDSRYSIVGMVDERCIVGRVVLRVLPLSKFGKVA